MHDCNLQYNVVGNMNCCEGTVMFQKSILLLVDNASAINRPMAFASFFVAFEDLLRDWVLYFRRLSPTYQWCLVSFPNN